MNAAANAFGPEWCAMMWPDYLKWWFREHGSLAQREGPDCAICRRKRVANAHKRRRTTFTELQCCFNKYMRHSTGTPPPSAGSCANTARVHLRAGRCCAECWVNVQQNSRKAIACPFCRAENPAEHSFTIGVTLGE